MLDGQEVHAYTIFNSLPSPIAFVAKIEPMIGKNRQLVTNEPVEFEK